MRLPVVIAILFLVSDRGGAASVAVYKYPGEPIQGVDVVAALKSGDYTKLKGVTDSDGVVKFNDALMSGASKFTFFSVRHLPITREAEDLPEKLFLRRFGKRDDFRIEAITNQPTEFIPHECSLLILFWSFGKAGFDSICLFEFPVAGTNQTG